MGVLLDGLPTAIEVSGKVYPIRYDYQTCLKIIMAFEDNGLTEFEKSCVLLSLLYVDVPEDTETALAKGVKFLDCGGENVGGGKGVVQDRLYSFTQDEKYIFSGVDRALGGRLSNGEPVHWWSFVLAFMELPEDCVMSRILYFRSQFAKGKLTKEELRAYNDNRELFDLQEETSLEEAQKEAEFFNVLKNS